MDQTAKEPLKHPFLQLIEDLRTGEAMEEYNQLIEDLIRTVKSTGRKGLMTIKLELTPTGTEGLGTIAIKDLVEVKHPRPKVAETHLFINKKGGLSTRDSRQMELAGLVDPKVREFPQN